MRITVDLQEFHDAFSRKGKSAHFSRAGLDALFHHLEDTEYGTNWEHELDVLELCEQYEEFEDLKDFQRVYGADFQTIEDVERATPVVLRIDWRNEFLPPGAKKAAFDPDNTDPGAPFIICTAYKCPRCSLPERQSK